MPRPRNYRVKQDANQAEILRELKKLPHLKWWVIAEPCDLLIVRPSDRRLRLVEVKNPDAEEVRMRASQLEAMRACPEDTVVAWNLEDVLRAFGVTV